MDPNLDAQLQAERDARAARGVGLAGPASLDMELYGGAGVEYASELVEEEPSSGAAGRLASLPQRVIQQHNLEAQADGEAALKRFRAENSSVSSAKIADREDEVRGGVGRMRQVPDRRLLNRASFHSLATAHTQHATHTHTHTHTYIQRVAVPQKPPAPDPVP
jgi:hypothetical protein